MTSLIKRPPIRDWIPYSTAMLPEIYFVEHYDVVYPVAGKQPMLAMRVAPVNARASKWPWQKRRQCLELWVYDTPDARRSVGRKVRLKRYGTTDDNFHVVARIVIE